MTTQLSSRRRPAFFRVGISAGALLLVLVVREGVIATPVLAQASGTACATQMTMLNASGRYIFDDNDADVLAGRRSGKFDFVRRETLLQAAYLGNATGVSPFGDTYDYSKSANRPSQSRVAHAESAKPFEIGAFGESGSLGPSGSALISSVHVDNDNILTTFVRKDPRPATQTIRCEYPTATDTNPGYLSPGFASNPMQPAGSPVSSWRIGSARRMVEHDRGTVNFTYYQTSHALAGIGVTRLIPSTGLQTGGGPGFSYAIDPYTRFYTTVSLQNQRPALSVVLQFK